MPAVPLPHARRAGSSRPKASREYSVKAPEAEALVMANPLHTIVRTSLTAGKSPNGNRGIEEQLRLHWARGDTVKLFADEYRCPIPAEVTARAIWELALAKRPGIYHLAGSERMSRLEIGQLIAAKHPELNPKIEPYSLRDHDGPPRAADTSLDCGKLQQLLSFPLRGLREWLTSDTPQPA